MATVLIVEDVPDLAPRVADSLAARGHRVWRCSGGASPYGACPLLRGRHCALAESANLIVFACTRSVPLARRSYRGEHLLAAYRSHEQCGRLPMLVVGGPLRSISAGGAGPVAYAESTASEDEIADAVDLLLSLAAVTRRPISADALMRRQVAMQMTRPNAAAVGNDTPSV